MNRSLHPIVQPVFVLAPAPELAVELRLPTTSTNLFQRLIRNPRPDSDRAKERECAEMLCAVLQNAPTLRSHVLTWLGSLVGLKLGSLNDLSFAIDTEQAIGSKRDDLRIVASSKRDDGGQPVLIWTVEIKVGASFHQSGQQLGDDQIEGSPAAEDQLMVNQILNYDHWLSRQTASHRAGFVLALTDRTADMPKALMCPWTCVSWTRLGEQVAFALRSQELPESEQLLARHVLGFIRDNLWRTSEMSDKRLDYNDVSLIRAFAVLAKECEAKVNGLVEPLVELIRNSGIGKGEVTHTQSLFKGQMCSYAERESGNQSWVYAGIGGDPESGEDYLIVGIESARSNPQKQAFKAFLKGVADSLLSRKWLLPSQEYESDWVDLSLTAPLAALLIADDQEKAICEFVGTALNDLAELGVADAFNRTVGSGVNAKRK